MPLITYKIATLPQTTPPATRPSRRAETPQSGEFICGLKAVGGILGLSADRIKILMEEGRIEFIRIGRRHYFRRECLSAVGRNAVEKKQGKNQPK